MKINNIQNQTLYKGNLIQSKAYKKLLFEDEIDEFVSSIIRKEREDKGRIYNYSETLSKKDIELSKKDWEESVSSFVLNDKIHFVKFGEKLGSFVDIIKKPFKN